MKTSLLAIILPIVLIGILAVVSISMYVTYSNQEVNLRVNIENKIKSNQSYFDKLWKIINEQAGVANEYKESFKEIYVEIMDKRYSDDSQLLFKWIQENNPTFDASLYKQINASIEAQRNGFHREQEELLAFNAEHTKLLSMIPSKFFLSGRSIIQVPIITSTRTDQVFETQKDDVLLFN